ncbi:hypothetical protein [Noviherbaspirillum pedocola]|uniref:Uncharacterized protein n=1 Tax=Noviherbaspirillum pedocola TaxID=2801341 RepID=A0A934SSY5_9BURK|nr:hypothetical protein [Noviherbaspirillum pedocola]MBK4736201.1 hypothetical protein [Noviherbaspirillum pedocola]
MQNRPCEFRAKMLRFFSRQGGSVSGHGAVGSGVTHGCGELHFEASDCHEVGMTTSGVHAYTATLTASRNGEIDRVFKRVFFIEMPGQCAWIGGYAQPDLAVRDPREAPGQVELFRYLRQNNVWESERLGRQLSAAVPEQSCEGRATAAFMRARGQQHSVRVGYVDANGEFRLAMFMPSANAPLYVVSRQSAQDRMLR